MRRPSRPRAASPPTTSGSRASPSRRTPSRAPRSASMPATTGGLTVGAGPQGAQVEVDSGIAPPCRAPGPGVRPRLPHRAGGSGNTSQPSSPGADTHSGEPCGTGQRDPGHSRERRSRRRHWRSTRRRCGRAWQRDPGPPTGAAAQGARRQAGRAGSRARARPDREGSLRRVGSAAVARPDRAHDVADVGTRAAPARAQRLGGLGQPGDERRRIRDAAGPGVGPLRPLPPSRSACSCSSSRSRLPTEVAVP